MIAFTATPADIPLPAASTAYSAINCQYSRTCPTPIDATPIRISPVANQRVGPCRSIRGPTSADIGPATAK